MRWWIGLIGAGFVSANAVSVLSQTRVESQQGPDRTQSNEAAPIVDSLEFAGLCYISSDAVKAQLSLLPGDRFDAAKLEHDMRTLGRLGWFSAIRVEEKSKVPPDPREFNTQGRIVLAFYFSEEPILSQVEYSGSRLLSTSQIEKLLEKKKLPPGLGKPADSATLQRIALAIRSALNELAHPDASVQTLRQVHENGTVSVHFRIADGPRLPVRQVRFEGNPGVPDKLLRAQMQTIAPWKPLASLRSKDAYTRPAFEEDRQRLLTYYQDHGYPEARIGSAHVQKFSELSRKWLPFPRHATKTGLSVSIPINTGPFYRLAAVEPSASLEAALGKHHGKPLPVPDPGQDHAFSQHEADKLRRYYSVHLRSGDSNSNASFQLVDANPIFDSVEHSVRLKLNLSDSLPYVVRRIEFLGLHKFNDRFVRRRIPLREGSPLDEHALEIGLTKLARTGYFKPISKENIHVQLDEAQHTADVMICFEEIGQQRVTFDGGRAQFGSTLGLAYTVFDLFSHEEVLSAKLDGGPESLQLLLGIAKDGIFGARSSLALSIFNNVIRPRFVHGVQGPFTASHTEGINVPWIYSLTNSDSLGVSYTFSRTSTDQTFGTTNSTTGSPIDLRTHTSSRSLGASWGHDSGNERVLLSNSVSGGALGGQENMLRSFGEAARIFRDPLFTPKNSWAFRSTFSAAGSYHGDMPFYSRFFTGDEYVRGLRTGELGPLAMTDHLTSSGLIAPSPSYAGASLVTAANAEYRIPFHNGVEATSFFDVGSGRLLPNWLGPTKPNLLSATNGILHGSTGIQFQWTIPGVQVPFRSYYAVNVLRLDRWIPLSEKSLVHAHNRFGAFGWGLGSLF
ncbi:MAG TPA: POTRA domain-containing protein [Candidatus Acidoferrum sp.]|nr:POTRA domain-containing protein [Candidatus Acidoferrum sp.]